MPVLNNVVFAYVKIQNPVSKYQSTDSEYTVDCIVSKAEAKEWNKSFPKQKAKVVENDEFTEKFKIDLPFPEQDEQFVIKMKKPHIKNGKPLDEKYRPRVFLASESGGEPTDITFTVLPANGSKGKAAYNERSNDFGVFAALDSILIEELVEYKPSTVVGGAFGVSSLAEAPPAKVVQKQSEASEDAQEAPKEEASNKVQAKPKSAPKAAPVAEEELEDLPF